MVDEPSTGKLGSPSKIRLRPFREKPGELSFWILSSEPLPSARSVATEHGLHKYIYVKASGEVAAQRVAVLPLGKLR